MYAVIMAGGKGERLWPKSTKGKAKHTLAFGTKNVMIKETINRLRHFLPVENIFLITTKAQYPSLKAYTAVLNRKNILLEPEGKDTAVAVCLSALTIEKRAGASTMVVLPADHIIKDSKIFFKNVLLAEKIANSEPCLVTIGIKPKYASVGYGYIQLGRQAKNYYQVKRFREKPKKALAEKFFKQGGYLWNSGIFVWNTESILNALKRHRPDVYYGLKDTVIFDGKKGYAVKLSNVYSTFKPISIDYGVMEPVAKSRALKILCLKAGFDWVDIGSWSSVEEIYDKDRDGNVVLSNSTLIDVKNSIIIGECGHKIGAIGVRDIVIVQTKSGTLICNKNRAQDVKELVRKF